MHKTMTFRKKYEMLPQKKQCINVEGSTVRIMVMPWPITSKTDIPGCMWMEAIVYKENGEAVRGISVCNPIDEFDFRIGAELALQDAFKTTAKRYVPIPYTGSSSGALCGLKNMRLVKYKIRKAIWKEFNKVLPK